MLLTCFLPWVLLIHFKHHFLRSEQLLPYWSKDTLLFCSPPIISCSSICYFFLGTYQAHYIFLFFCFFVFFFASILMVVSPISISVPLGQQPGLFLLLLYLGFSAQFVTHRTGPFSWALHSVIKHCVNYEARYWQSRGRR